MNNFFCFTKCLFRASTCFEHMCSKHVEAWNKLIVKKNCVSSLLITGTNIRTVSKTSKNILTMLYVNAHLPCTIKFTNSYAIYRQFSNCTLHNFLYFIVFFWRKCHDVSPVQQLYQLCPRQSATLPYLYRLIRLSTLHPIAFIIF